MKTLKFILAFVGIIFSIQAFAAISCPSGQALNLGKIPNGWQQNPLTQAPQAGADYQFTKASIPVTNGLVACFYKSSEFPVTSIIKQGTFYPNQKANWFRDPQGVNKVCVKSREQCQVDQG